MFPTVIGAILARVFFVLPPRPIADGAHKNGAIFEGRDVASYFDRTALLFRSHCSMYYSLVLCQNPGGYFLLPTRFVRRHFALCQVPVGVLFIVPGWHWRVSGG